MSVGSLIGAVMGGMLVGVIPAAALKIVLGIILNVSAVQMFHGGHATPRDRTSHQGNKA